jgi:hypothetical protein
VDRDSPSPWSGCSEAFAVMEEFRDYATKAVRSSSGFAWLLRMDPQITEAYDSADYGVRKFGKEIYRAERSGDEIGLHTHFYRWNQTRHRWIIDHGNEKWVTHCLFTAFAAFSTAFSRQCRTYRSGDRWHRNASVRLVEDLGVHFDLTLESGAPAALTYHPSEDFTGTLPDYTKVPPYPFQPSRHDFRVPDPARSRSIWMIPLAGGAYGLQPTWRRSWKRVAVQIVDPFRRIGAFAVRV